MTAIKKEVDLELNWFSPSSGAHFNFDDIIKILKAYTRKGGKIFIGTDSILNNQGCVFARAICLHGAPEGSGGRYFISRSKESDKAFEVLPNRMLAEVEKTIDVALKISNECPSASIELHLDISGTIEKGETGKYADMLTGYARSTGFPFKVKPDSWASSSVADRHSK